MSPYQSDQRHADSKLVHTSTSKFPATLTSVLKQKYFTYIFVYDQSFLRTVPVTIKALVKLTNKMVTGLFGSLMGNLLSACGGASKSPLFERHN